MTSSSSRATRRSGSWRAALTVPALAATTLLVPAFTSPATAAEGNASQNVRGYCNVAEDLGRTESAINPVTVNLPPLSTDVYAGHADAARQIAASYTDVDWNADSGAGYESCSTSADYTQLLTVGAGTSGLPEGTPVTLRAAFSFAGTLDSGNHPTLESDALTNFFADYRIDDLDSPCVPTGEGGCYNGPAVDFSVWAERNTWGTPDTWSDPDGYLYRSHEWDWQLRGNSIAGHLGDDYYDEAKPCPSFPCDVITGPTPSAMDPLVLDLGTKTVEFTTTVGATLRVASGVDTYAAGADAPAEARADVLEGVRGTITGLPGSGLEVLLGTGPFQTLDTTAPTVDITASPEPNAAGWNSTDVTVFFSATDEAGGSGVKQLTRGATGAQSIPFTTHEGSAIGQVISAEGITEVRAHATDNSGNTSSGTTKTIRIDKTAPVISATVPTSTVADAGGTAAVTYASSATDNLDTAPSLSCTSPSGSTFPVGTTTVTCTSTDHAGNSAATSFDVVVTAAPGGGGGEVPAPTAVQQVDALAAAIDALPVKTGLKQSLVSHVRPLQRSVATDDPRSCHQLANLVKKVEQEARKGLTAAQAASLRTRTDLLHTTLGC